MRFLTMIAIAVLMSSCFFDDMKNYPEDFVLEGVELTAAFTEGPMTGDAVVAAEALDVYAQADTGSEVLGTQPAGAAGVIVNGPKTKNGEEWAVVDFDSGPDGKVLYWLLTDPGDPVDPPSPPPPPPSGGASVWGALGCSMSRNLWDPGVSLNTSIIGWLKEDPQGNNVLKSYSGGTIVRWASGNNVKWGAYERGLNTWGADAILWQLCTSQEEVDAVGGSVAGYRDELEYVFNRMSAMAGAGVPVYVTGLPRYAPGHECHITEEDGVQFSRDLAAYAATVTGAIYADGLDLELVDAGDLKKDGCHSSAQGSAGEAQTLEAWMTANGL